ncbi:hypothetical protein LCGC14_0108680 [marine sediment metagenome]
MRSVKGFTLIELMVTVAVLAIVVAIAVPNINAWIDSSSARSQVNLYRDMLNYARSEAINRGEPVRLKQLGDKSWVVGTGNPANCAAADALRCFPSPRDGMKLTANSIPAAGLIFTTQGQVRGQDAGTEVSLTITFEKYCEANRTISVNGIGRIRSLAGACS